MTRGEAPSSARPVATEAPAPPSAPAIAEPLGDAPAAEASGRIRALRIGLILGALLVWEGVLRLGIISPFFLAAPTEVLAAAGELVQMPEVRGAFLQTLAMVCVSFVIAAVGGLLLGAWLGLSNWAYGTFHPMVSLAMSTPKLIFLPLMLVVFGIGATSKVAYGVLSAIFYITVNVTAGVRMVDPSWLRAMKSMGASPRDRLVLVVLPGSLPAIAVGLWYGIKHALLGVLIAELFASVRGLGFYIKSYTSSFQVDKVYALILSLSGIAIAIGWLWKRLDDRVSRWRPTS